MRLIAVFLAAVFLVAPLAHADDDLIVKPSPHGVAKTLDRLTAIMQKKGITIFARINHAAGAKKIGTELRPTEVLLFGNPKLGTPMMQSNQQIGLDLPLKAVAWQDAGGKVWLAYTKPSELAERYGITDRAPVVKKMTGALNNLTNAAIKP